MDGTSVFGHHSSIIGHLVPLPDLDILVAIAETGSLTAAADHLGLPRPTLSRRLARLEEEVGAPLVERTTRRTALTEAGQTLYRHARPIVDAIEAAGDAVRTRDGMPRGLLRVSIPGAEPTIAEMLVAFAEAHPAVRLEVVSTARHVDLESEGFDVALRAGSLTGPSLISRLLRRNVVLAVATPGYLERHGVPSVPEDLVQHRCLVGFATGEHPQRVWPRHDGGTAPVTPAMASNDPRILVAAARRGLGIALLPQQFADRDLQQGALVPILADVVGLRTGIWLVYPEKKRRLPRVRAFVEHVVDWTETRPWIGVAPSGDGP